MGNIGFGWRKAVAAAIAVLFAAQAGAIIGRTSTVKTSRPGSSPKRLESVSASSALDATVLGTLSEDKNGNLIVKWNKDVIIYGTLTVGEYDSESAFLKAYCEKCEARADKSQDGSRLGAAGQRKSAYTKSGKKIWAAHQKAVRENLAAEKRKRETEETEKALNAGLPIESLFGIAFGSQEDVDARDKTPDGKSYLFTPAKRFRKFSVYSFKATPDSRLVYQIQAALPIAEANGVDLGEEVQAVKKALMKKFQKQAAKDLPGASGFDLVFPGDGADEGRRVSVRCAKAGISIVAVDLDLRKRAQDEQSATEAAKTDEDVDAL